jgi:hypothetical protein
MKNKAIEEIDDRIIAHHLIRVIEYRVDHVKASLRETCDALELPYTTVKSWIDSNKFSNALESLHSEQSDLAQAIALEGLPGVVKTMIDIATGKRDFRGSNPQAAADIVMRVAQMGARATATEPKIMIQQNTFVPEIKKGDTDLSASPIVIDAD